MFLSSQPPRILDIIPKIALQHTLSTKPAPAFSQVYGMITIAMCVVDNTPNGMDVCGVQEVWGARCGKAPKERLFVAKKLLHEF